MDVLVFQFQPELFPLAGRVLFQRVGDGEAQQPERLVSGIQFFHHGPRQGKDVFHIRQAVRNGHAPGFLDEVRKFDFQRQGIAPEPGARQAPRQFFRQKGEAVFQGLRLGDVFPVGLFTAYGLADARRFHGPFVNAAGEVVEKAADFSEVADQEFHIPFPELRPIGDGKGAHACGGGMADAPEGFNRQAGDEFLRTGGVDDEQSVRLAVVGSDFGQEFIVGDSRGGRQVEFLPYLFLDAPCDVHGQGNSRFVFRNVQEGLVQGKGFHQIGVTVEDGLDLCGNGFIHVHPVADKDEPGAELHRLHGRHGGTDPEAARLITGGGHHAAHFRPAHGNGLAAIFGMVALFDGCVKGIHVYMDDFSLFHEEGTAPVEAGCIRKWKRLCL